MATKMAGRLTVPERAQIAACYEVWNSVVAVQRWWRTVKGRNATIRHKTIKNCHSKLLTTGSVTDTRRSDHPSTSRSEENMALVRDMFTPSLRKSTCQAACKSGPSRHTVCTVLKKKDLNIRPRKPHYVQELTRWLGRRGPHEWPARSPDLTPCGARRRRRCTGQNLAQWNNWRTGFGTLSPTSHATFCRRLWMPSPVVWRSWWMPPVPTLNFKLYVHIPI